MDHRATTPQSVLWLAQTEVKTSFINQGSPWENGYVESFT